MWKVILFAHDFSDCAAQLEPTVAELARTLCARVVVCHVAQGMRGLPPNTVIRPPGEEGPMKVGDYALRMSTERLVPIAERMGGECVTVETAARFDDSIERGILAVAKEVGAEVIVMGTHGRTGLEHLVLGSIAEKVLRRADVPVITLRTPAKRKTLREDGVLEDEQAG